MCPPRTRRGGWRPEEHAAWPQNPGLRRLIVNASYWCMGMEADIAATRSVEVVGTYAPLESGFDYKKIGVVAKPVSAYK